METEKNLASLELAVQRLQETEVAWNAARADVETEAVAAVRAGADIGEVAEACGIPEADLRQLGADFGENLPR
jgi:hypothetical protein